MASHRDRGVGSAQGFVEIPAYYASLIPRTRRLVARVMSGSAQKHPRSRDESFRAALAQHLKV